MIKFSSFVVRLRWVLVAIFVAATVFCGIMLFNNTVLYDLSSYVPQDSNTEASLKVLKSEFDDKGSAYIMVKGVSREEADAISQELADIEGVAAAVINVGNYRNNSALYNVVLDDYDATDGANNAIASIIEHLDDREAYLTGQSAMSYYTRLETFESILKVGVVIAVGILFMLFFTSKTFFEPILMLLVFVVAVVINMGTNYWFNGISYISNLIALVLQLALSIDYSVILLHRFMEERAVSDAKTAIIAALAKGIPEILSSSLTTVAGLCSLILMTLPIGVEIGLSLSKSIIASLICVIFLMPALLVIFDKPLQKTKHKNFVPNVTKPARGVVKARKVIVPVFIAVIALAGTGQFFNKYSYNINGAARIVSSQEKIAEDFGVLNSIVVIVPKGDYQKEKALTDYVLAKEGVNGVTGLASIEVTDGLYLTDKVNLAEIKALGAPLGLTEEYADILFGLYRIKYDPDSELSQDEYKAAVIDLLEYAYGMAKDGGMQDAAEQLEPLMSARPNFEGKSYARIIFNINSPVESDLSLRTVAELETELKQFYDEYYLAGESVACYDMSLAFPIDNTKVNVFTVCFVLVILLFTFKNLLLPSILMLAIQGGIWINFAIPLISSNPVSFIGYLLISGIQMGATIDYAIVLTSRYQSNKLLFVDKVEAIANAENAVFPTIITSGTILTITGFGLGLLASGVVAQMGMLVGVGALSSMIIVLFVLPSMLLVFDKISEKASFGYMYNKIKSSINRTHVKRCRNKVGD